jgi:NADPH:quinone reductase-like Zn-dependent oxidoreductase
MGLHGFFLEVLQVGEQPTPEPGPGEVRVHLRTSGANPSWKSRSGRAAPMSAPMIIPHSDGAGDIDRVGAGAADRVGERVWIWNRQWRRSHGTAAEYIVLPSVQALPLPAKCFGFPQQRVGTINRSRRLLNLTMSIRPSLRTTRSK